MSRIPPLNFFGRNAPMISIPYVPESHHRLPPYLPPQYHHSPYQFDQYGQHLLPQERHQNVIRYVSPPQYDGQDHWNHLEPNEHHDPRYLRDPRDFRDQRERPHDEREFQDLHDLPDQRNRGPQNQTSHQNPTRTNSNDPLLPYYHKQDQQKRGTDQPSSQYGPPPDFYDSKLLKQSQSQNRPQENKENVIDPLNYSHVQHQQKDPGPKPTYYPFIKPTLAPPHQDQRNNPYVQKRQEDQQPPYPQNQRSPNKLDAEFAEPVHLPNPDYFEEPVPIINFYPPEHMQYYGVSPIMTREEDPIDFDGRLVSYQNKAIKKDLSREYTHFIRDQVWRDQRPFYDEEDERICFRKRWEIKEIYGNLKAEFDDRGNIVFNNIKYSEQGSPYEPSNLPYTREQQRPQISQDQKRVSTQESSKSVLSQLSQGNLRPQNPPPIETTPTLLNLRPIQETDEIDSVRSNEIH